MSLLNEALREADKVRDEIVELLQDLVRVPTVNTGIMPTGNETELCELLKDKLEREGISSEIIGGVPNRGNLVARLDGSQDGKAKLMFMSHTDVVPAGDESKWLYSPFGGEVHDGRLYGRGSNDCKSLTACETMAMILLKRLGVPLKRSIILAAGSDEETGSKSGFRWLVANAKEKIAAEFAINEGGGTCFTTPKGLCWGVALGEKGRLEAHINLSGRSCHASVPWHGDNALVKLSQAVEKINTYKPELSVSAPAFKELPRLFSIEETSITPENVDNLVSQIPDKDSVVGSMLRGLSRMTITPTMVSGGIKSNVVPDTFELVCDIRVLPGQDIQYVTSQLEKALSDIEGCKIEIRGTTNPSSSPTNSDFLQAIERSLMRVMETNVDVMQTLTVGFTDSSAVRPLGTIVYNFSPYHPDSDISKSNVHGVDESIAVEDLVFRTKVLTALAYELAT